MAKSSQYYIVDVEDTVIQVTSYLVWAEDKEEATRLIEAGVYAFESVPETADTVSSEIKNIEEVGGNK